MGFWRRTKASIIVLVTSVGLGLGGPDAHAQATGVLRLTVTVAAGGGDPTPVQRHVLLVSDNPPSRVPWRVMTAKDGTARVTLPPGNYTVESEAPLVAQGHGYEWRQEIQVAAGRDTTLALTPANAEVRAAPPPEPGTPARVDAWDLLIKWQDSVVTLWTTTTRASGVVVASSGLIVTTHRVVRDAATVEVQLTPTLKVAGRVLTADSASDVAVLWIDPAAIAERTPLPLACDQPTPSVHTGMSISAIGMPLRGQPHTAEGVVTRVQPAAITVDLDFAVASAGGPVFAAGGELVGLISVPGAAEGTGESATVVPVASICGAMASAHVRSTTATAPTGARLPVEPPEAVDDDLLRNAVKRRAGSLNPYQAASATFDVALITPVVAFAGLQGAMDFGQWSNYVADRPPVLLVRVTPKQVERFWIKMARGAALTQGIALPPIKHFTPGFARLRALCDGSEVTPIHPFVIERRVSASNAIREGLYVFAPDALGPQCKTVTLEVFSEKAPDKRETATIGQTMLTQLWADLAPYRRPEK